MKRLHLICNAHLDPIWQWTWDEGISAAIATFKSAADLADEFDYIFCHGESLLYEAIEKNAPSLFKRIQGLVKAGKWHISSGTYLQPDCLMPSGEAFVRQIKVGKKYFQEKFGVEPTVMTNFDSFGHSVGLPQILAKNGYNGYMHCRPNGMQFEYPAKFYRWISPDGSSVTATETFSYNSALGNAVEKIKTESTGEQVGMLGSEASASTRINLPVDYVLWGVGNHGGGPSRKDLKDIANLKIDGVQLIHSTPEKLFAEIQPTAEVKESTITCMPGCYSSMARVKQAYRKTENLFFAIEKMLASAKLAGFNPDLSELENAEKKMLLAQFHDILPGTCIEEGEREGLGLLSASEKTLKDYRTDAFLYAVMEQDKAGEGEYPVFVFNYEAKKVKTLIEVEFSLADQNWEDCEYEAHIYTANGEELPCQRIKEDSMLNLDWRKRILFEGELLPLGVTRFTVKTTPVAIKEKKIKAIDLVENALVGDLLRTGASLDMYEDTADPWGMSKEELQAMGKNPVPFRLMHAKEAQEFCRVNDELPPVRVIEEGDIYTGVEALYTAGKTNAVLQYRLYKNKPYIDLKATVEFADKNRLVRLKVPVPNGFENAKAFGDGPFVCEDKPNTEISFQKWLGVKRDDGQIFAVLNDGVYAGKVEDGYIHLTLLRGSGYCMHPIPDRELYLQDRYLPRIDCGKYVYNFRIFKGNVFEVCEQAERLNQPPYAVNIFPVGGGTENAKTDNRVCVDGEMILCTCKIKEDGGYVLRLYNPDTKEKEFTARIGEERISGIAKGGEVVSVVFEKGKAEVLHDSMPV
ncbi:MAG: hypothetical protein E7381_03460 [Clostridiales bacterium]|nr:hypothetical protein [Clostridiales bacterium]